MSFQAVAWAMKQELPVIPKFILVALCERANPDTGECWPGIETVAKAVCLSERSVVTYIAALVRNGYVMRQAMRGKDGRRRTNHYWIMFDRPEAAWISTVELAEENAENPENEPHANPASGEDTEVQTQTVAPGPDATGFLRHIMPEPSGIEPSESEIRDGAPSPPVDFDPKIGTMSRVNLNLPWPKEFVKEARQKQIERLNAAEEARKPKRIPVIEGSKPWDAWIRHGHPRTLKTDIKVDGRRDIGWYFPTLYPPKEATGPPLPNLLTPEDEAELSKKWG